MRVCNLVSASACLWLLAGLLANPHPAFGQELVRVKRAHYVMGTLFEITAYGSDKKSTESTVELAFQAIRHADEVMSHYKPESDLMRLNREGADGPVEVPVSLYHVLAESLRYSELSGGAFDITIGPLVRLWDRAAEGGRLPTETELTAAGEVLGSENVQLLLPGPGETPGAQVRLVRPGVEVNLGAIGKGWAVDRAMEILTSHGIRNAFISAGTSTVYARGSEPGEEGWRVELVNACREEESLGSITLQDASLSTSASYEQYWEIGGKRYSHILDPRTGWPVEPLASVTVIAPTATESDALSTAVYVAGLEEGRELLVRTERDGILVDKEAGGGCAPHVVNGSGKSLEFRYASIGASHGN